MKTSDQNPITRYFLRLALAAMLLPLASTRAADVALLNSPTGNATFVANFQAFIESEGHSFVRNPATLTGIDVVFDIRITGNQALIDFVAGGGLLVTEFSGTNWVLNTAHLLTGTDASAGNLGSGTPVTFTSAGLARGLGDGLPNPYSDGSATEFFRNYTNLGPDVEILATRGANLPAIIGGSYGEGYIVGIGYDWGDAFIPNTAPTRQLIHNVLAVPEPGSAALLALGSFVFLRRRR